ncbi:hypothetical protein EG68_05090 [Paragonimus skrjabini miyazakii]|uniref:Dipeptidyl peptidase 1 n=1 Tax=Paragonimus skrjabini miyazakii TaxID=59628 RepID=A0A8S9YVG6_9TREM|nr:hypothetical protein EG68_05090 [Paragonimus skrjabini miyazakii]
MIRSCGLLVLLLQIFNTLLLSFVNADTPANCTYEDARGQWLFEVCDHENCPDKEKEQFVFELLYPNLVNVIKGHGSSGVWTLISNQGFDVHVAHRKWLVMFDYGPDGESYCDRGRPGWTLDSLVRQKRWFTSHKLSPIRSRPHATPRRAFDSSRLDMLYRADPAYIDKLNEVQHAWKAVKYPDFEKLTHRDLIRLAGGFNANFPRPRELINQSRPSRELLKAAADLPREFDWRFPGEGQPSPVTAVRNQGPCGSCYAFASTGALEARIRLLSNFTRQPFLSPQDIVDCSPYSEGCHGGFAYLIGGKYAEVFGIPEEKCDPYTGVKADECPTKPDCPRYYATNYRYIGGYYGACNELLMKLELVHGGPFPIGFMVYDDFIHYRSGVYRHTQLENTVHPFYPVESTNHAVLLVGYGVDKETNLPYWSVKNSWGRGWGEDGFFRILRGSNECGVEGVGVAFDPIL